MGTSGGDGQNEIRGGDSHKGKHIYVLCSSDTNSSYHRMGSLLFRALNVTIYRRQRGMRLCEHVLPRAGRRELDSSKIVFELIFVCDMYYLIDSSWS